MPKHFFFILKNLLSFLETFFLILSPSINIITRFNPENPEDEPHKRNKESDSEHHNSDYIELRGVHCATIIQRHLTIENAIQNNHHDRSKEIETDNHDSLVYQ
jgi:hypothetical protein